MALMPEYGIRRMAGIRFKFTFALTVVAVLGLVCPAVPQSPQQRVKLPEVIRRLSKTIPYHICTRTIDNIWECVSSSSATSNNVNTPNKEPETEISSTTPPSVLLTTTTERSTTTSIGSDGDFEGDGTMGGSDGSIGGVDGNIGESNGSISGVNGNIGESNGSIGGVDGNIGESNGSIGGVDGNIGESNGSIGGVDGNIDESNGSINGVNDNTGESNGSNGGVDGNTGERDGSKVGVNGRESRNYNEISSINETNYDTDTTLEKIPSMGTTINNCPPTPTTATTMQIPNQDPIENSSSFMDDETATKINGISADQNLPTTSTSSTTASTDLLPSPSNPSALIFQDNFDRFDMETWKHQITMAGGGNWEFQIYVNNRSNSFVKDGMLHIRPTLTAELFGDEFLYSGKLSIYGGTPSDHCTNNEFNGCERTGNEANILNPVLSARIQTAPFSFRYGRIVVRAKLPSGDWIRPDITLLPLTNQYGKGPASGKICIVEARGNKNLTRNEESIGIDRAFSSIEFGPFIPYKNTVEVSSSSAQGFDQDFHTFELEWRSNFMRFSTDGIETGRMEPPEGGFWNLTTLKLGDDVSNPWENAENRNMAPFDQKFYISLGLAVGGTTGFFPDDLQAAYPKPWTDTSTTAYKDFWDNRFDWLPSWENSSFIIDYIEVYE